MVVPEPISITIAVFGLLKAAHSVTTTITDLTKAIPNAPNSAHNALSETKAVAGILRQLQSYLDGASTAPRSRSSMVTLEEIVATLTDCVCAFSEFENILNKIKIEEMGALARAKWAWHQDKIVKITARLQTQKSSLTLMFTILTCKSQQAASEASSALASRVEELYAANVDLRGRVMALEFPDTEADAGSETSSDAASTIIARKPDTSSGEASSSNILNAEREEVQNSELTQRSPFSSDILALLQGSRVYRRAEHPHVRSSIIQDELTVRYSLISEVTWSQISRTSVLALPVSITEISNAEYYRMDISYEPSDDNNATFYDFLEAEDSHSTTDDEITRVAAPVTLQIRSVERSALDIAPHHQSNVSDSLMLPAAPNVNFDLAGDQEDAQVIKLALARFYVGDAKSLPQIQWLAVSVHDVAVEKSEPSPYLGFPFLSSVSGEVFGVVWEHPKYQCWLAKSYTNSTDMLGWIWEGKFAKLSPQDVRGFGLIRPAVDIQLSAMAESSLLEMRRGVERTAFLRQRIKSQFQEAKPLIEDQEPILPKAESLLGTWYDSSI